MRFDFTARVAVVTGAASGIGRATVARLVAGGARVAAIDKDAVALDELKDDFPGRVRACVLNVIDSAAVTECLRDVEDRFGGIDALICSAGTVHEPRVVADTSDEQWHGDFAVNCHGVFYCNRAVLPSMTRRGYGRIVNVSSLAGKHGDSGQAAYSAAKAAVIGFTKALGREVAGYGVLVNCLAPGVIDTPAARAMLSEQQRADVAERTPARRLGTAEETADFICYLASPALGFAAGACFDLSGGRAMY